MNALRLNQYLPLFFVEFSAIMAAHPGKEALALFYVIPLAISLFIGYRHIHHGVSFDAEKFKNGVALVGLFFFIPALFSGQFFSGLLTVMSWLIIAMNIGLKERRELYFLLVGTFILFLYGTSVNMHTGFLFWIILYTLSVLMVLVHDNFNKILAHATEKKVTESKQTTLFLSVLIMTLSTLIYLLVPRPDAINIGFLPAGGYKYYKQSGWKSEATNKPGEASSQFTPKPSSHAQQTQDETEAISSSQHKEVPSPPSNNPAMSLEPDNAPIPGDELLFVMKGKHPQYLRGYVFDYFNGTEWLASDNQYEKLRLKQQSISLGTTVKLLDQYSITIKKKVYNNKIIYIPVNTKQLDFPGSVIARNSFGTLFASDTLKEETFYTASIAAEWVEGHPRNAALMLGDKSRYLQLPKGFSPAIKTLAEDLKEPISEFKSALAIESHFRENFNYSYTTLYSYVKENALEHFIFESRHGHCEYFATSMALMLRSIGIQARIVSGYSATTLNPVTGFYEVRAINAHSWVEAYVDALGWVSFEPTPAYTLPAKKENKAMTEMLEEYLETLEEMKQHQEHATIFKQLQYLLIEAFDFINRSVQQFGEILKDSIALFIYFMQTVGFYALIVLFGVYALWYHMRISIWQQIAERKIKRAQTKSSFLHDTYNILDSYFTKVKIAKEAHETLVEYSYRLQDLYPEQKELIEQFFSKVHQNSYQKNYTLLSSENSYARAVRLLYLPIDQPPFRKHIIHLLKELIA